MHNLQKKRGEIETFADEVTSLNNPFFLVPRTLCLIYSLVTLLHPFLHADYHPEMALYKKFEFIQRYVDLEDEEWKKRNTKEKVHMKPRVTPLFWVPGGVQPDWLR